MVPVAKCVYTHSFRATEPISDSSRDNKSRGNIDA